VEVFQPNLADLLPFLPAGPLLLANWPVLLMFV